MTTIQTTLHQDLGSLAADLVSAGNHEGAALVTSAANELERQIAELPALAHAIPCRKYTFSGRPLPATIPACPSTCPCGIAQQAIAASSEPVEITRESILSLQAVAHFFEQLKEGTVAKAHDFNSYRNMTIRDAQSYAECLAKDFNTARANIIDAFDSVPSTNQPVQAKALTDEQILQLASNFDHMIGVHDGNGLITYLTDGTDISHVVLRFARALLASQPSASSVSELRSDALCDMHYSHGLQQGFMYGESGDHDGYSKTLQSREGYIATLKATSGESAQADVAAVRDAAQRFLKIACTVREIEEDDLTAAQMTEFDRARHALDSALKSAAPTVAPARIDAEFDVRNIVLRVVPGEHGMGEEIHAKDIHDVTALLTEQDERIEYLQTMLDLAPTAQPQADAKTCDHIYIMKLIDGPNVATSPAVAVCMHCGYEPQADGVKQ